MKRKLPRTVVILGLVSFFNDMASEMVTPFIPILIATVLGAGPVILGLLTTEQTSTSMPQHDMVETPRDPNGFLGR